MNGPCCSPEPGPGCGNTECESAVCELFPECCTIEWDALCGEWARCVFFEECNCPDHHCDKGGGEPPVEHCNCCDPHGGLGCDNEVCEGLVCAIDPFCCSSAWDSICAGEALDFPECVECCEAP